MPTRLLTIHTPAARPARALLYGALFTLSLAACDGAADNSAGEDDNAAPASAEPAAQFGGTVLGVGGVEATVATEATKALFKPGTCDDVYEFRFFGAGGPGTPYMVQPGGEYQPTVQFDAPWGDAPAQAIEFKPLIDNAKVTHHFILMAGTMGWLDAWAPGNDDPPLPSNVGMDLPRGKRSLALNMHYYNLTGTKPEPDRSGLAVCVVRGERLRPKLAAVHMGFAAIKFPVMVPANTKNHELVGECTATVKEPVTLFSMGPHAHKLGRHMKFTVTKADGRVITLHDQPFSFDEQATHPVDPLYTVENGDKFRLTCTYDNETNKNFTFGENTDNEMCFNFAVYYPKGALSCGGFGSLGAGGFPAIPPARPATPPAAAPTAPAAI
ncbi:MAG: hypothetical protein ABW252_08560 [Polyangiales bacterium]